jgi:hypothetical protein
MNHPNLYKKLNEDEDFRVRVGGAPAVEGAPGRMREEEKKIREREGKSARLDLDPI